MSLSHCSRVIAVTDTTLDQPSDPPTLRARMRQERQARVGILRNTNQPPRPPARRAKLMGKWLNLRSSRRPHPRTEPAAQPAAPAKVAQPHAPANDAAAEPFVGVSLAADGSVAAIDVKSLMASVEGYGTAQPVRAAFASEFRHDVARPAKQIETPRSTRPSILSPEAWEDDDDEDEDEAPEASAPAPTRVPRKGRRSGPIWWAVKGFVLFASALLVARISMGALGPVGG
ncbi:MAG: hypothetical protein Kow0013_19370 [Pararhodobacter sp.]